MSINTSYDILKIEVDKLIEDIIEVYENSGKKVTGEFPEGLQIDYSNNGNAVEIYGYGYFFYVF